MKKTQPANNASAFNAPLVPAPASSPRTWLAGLQAGADLRAPATGAPSTQASANAESSIDASPGRRSSAPAPIAGETASALLEQALCASAAFPPAVFRWLQDALQAYTKEGRAGTLERHLGLNVEQHRGRSAVRRLVVQKRWDALGAAYTEQIGCGALTPQRRCAILVDDLEEFEKSFWQRWRKNGPPGSVSLLRQALFQVFTTYDGTPPRNANSIYATLQRAKIIGSAQDSRE